MDRIAAGVLTAAFGVTLLLWWRGQTREKREQVFDRLATGHI